MAAGADELGGEDVAVEGGVDRSRSVLVVRVPEGEAKGETGLVVYSCDALDGWEMLLAWLGVSVIKVQVRNRDHAGDLG